MQNENQTWDSIRAYSNHGSVGGNRDQPAYVAVDTAGNLWVALAFAVAEVSTEGVTTTLPGIGTETGIAVDSKGNVYLSDTYNNRVLFVSTGGSVTTVAGNGIVSYSGDGVPATSAQLGGPTGVALDASTGTLYIADCSNNRVREVSPAGVITTLAGNWNRGVFRRWRNCDGRSAELSAERRT